VRSTTYRAGEERRTTDFTDNTDGGMTPGFSSVISVLSVVKQYGMGEWRWLAGEFLSFLSFFAANGPLRGHMRKLPERVSREKAQKAHKR